MSSKPETENETQNQLKITTINDAEVEEKPPTSRDDNRRGGRALNLIKAALSILRRPKGGGGKPPTAPLPATRTNTSALTRLVGCVRPLHQLQGGGVGGGPLLAGVAPPPSASPEEHGHGDSSEGTMSRYASAQSLCDMDDGGVNEMNECCGGGGKEVFYDGVEGDEMIDAKADLFIAKFYEQIKLDHHQDDLDS